jgi:hypothetical protein
MKSRTHVIARDSSSALIDEYHHNRERAVTTLKQRFSVRLQQVEQKLKRDLRELKDGELQKVYAACTVQLFGRAAVLLHTHAVAPGTLWRRNLSSGKTRIRRTAQELRICA